MSFLSAINPNNWLSGALGKTDAGLGNRFGGILNDLTGASASARQQFNNNMALQHDAQEFAKWQMANAHQMEVQDLQNAGLNPVLSANGGASAGGVSANSTGSGTPSGNPIEMIGSIFNMLNTAKQTNALVDKTKAEVGNINADTENKKQEFEWTPAMNASLIKLQTANSSQAQTQAQKNITDNLAQQFMNKMRDMDVKKRTAEWDRELATYKEQMKTILREAGVDNTTMGIIINGIGKTVNAMLPLSNFTPSGGNTYNVNSPTVNY